VTMTPRRTHLRWLCLVVAAGLWACRASDGSGTSASTLAERGPTVGVASAASGAAPLATPVGAPDRAGGGAAPSSPIPAVQCGKLRCWRFDKANQALEVLLVRRPEVLAFGEAHALVGTEGIPTATERFETQFLPLLARNGAAQLVVELLAPAQGCEKTVQKVKKQQQPVVRQQDVGNQDRFVRLGHASKALGITPFILEPSCEEYAGVARGGADGVVRMLELIAQKTEVKLTKFVAHNRQGGSQPAAATASSEALRPGDAHPKVAPRLALAYGGAMHNDVSPSADKERFSFGKQIVSLTAGRYLEVDLIVPEYIKDTQAWRDLPWYEHFDPNVAPQAVTLLEVGPQSYTLIFARTAQ